MNGSSTSLAAAAPAASAASVSTSAGRTMPPPGVAEDVLEQDLERDGTPPEVEPEWTEGAQPVEVGEARTEARAGAERVAGPARVVPSLGG